MGGNLSGLVEPLGAVLFDLRHLPLPFCLALRTDHVGNSAGITTFGASVRFLAIGTNVIMRIVSQATLPFQIVFRA